MVNYKQIIQDLSGIAYYHNQINSFGFGDLKQITNDIETHKEPVYPKMYVVPNTVSFNQNAINYQLNIIILDQVNDDLSNQKNVVSDTLEITKDIFTILYHSYTTDFGGFSNDYTPNWGASLTPFLERFETILAGWTLSINIEQPFDYNKCNVPTGNLILDQSDSISYLQLISDLEYICDNHPQVNSFGFGELTQLTNDIETNVSPLYTKVYVMPGDTILNQNQLDYNLQIIIADRLNDDYSNQRDVLNDTLEIAKDLFTIFSIGNYEVEWNASVEPFLEQYEDVLTGWVLNLKITQVFDYNRCNIPVNSFKPGMKWYELAELWNEISKDWKSI